MLTEHVLHKRATPLCCLHYTLNRLGNYRHHPRWPLTANLYSEVKWALAYRAFVKFVQRSHEQVETRALAYSRAIPNGRAEVRLKDNFIGSRAVPGRSADHLDLETSYTHPLVGSSRLESGLGQHAWPVNGSNIGNALSNLVYSATDVVVL